VFLPAGCREPVTRTMHVLDGGILQLLQLSSYWVPGRVLGPSYIRTLDHPNRALCRDWLALRLERTEWYGISGTVTLISVEP
jgi:hypothetical protein